MYQERIFAGAAHSEGPFLPAALTHGAKAPCASVRQVCLWAQRLPALQEASASSSARNFSGEQGSCLARLPAWALGIFFLSDRIETALTGWLLSWVSLFFNWFQVSCRKSSSWAYQEASLPSEAVWDVLVANYLLRTCLRCGSEL